MTTKPPSRRVILPVLILSSICWYPAQGAMNARYEEFVRLAREGKKTEALGLGGQLFKILVDQKPDDAALIALSKRLAAAQRIGTLATGAVKPSPTKLLEGMGGLDDLGLPPAGSKNRDVPAALPPSAQELYWTHVDAFTGELALKGLPPQAAAFLDQYYHLQIQNSIMGIGRQVLVADPNSAENACYAIVLPLLYLCGRDNTWDQMEPFLSLFPLPQLDALWRFALLEAERPEASAQIARCQAKKVGKDFSVVVWAPAAADVCAANHRPDLARKSLQMAIEATNDRDQAAEMRLKIAEGYARGGDYAAAAGACQQIVHDLPDSSLYGRIMVTYFGYLAREAKANQLVVETEPALQEGRCQPYLPQILYLRWWALCKTNRQDEAIRIGQRLVEQYPRHPCAAPVLLERAIDALARQQYDKCRELLTKLTKDLSGTESAKRGEEILARLQGRGIPSGKDRLSPTQTGTAFKER